MRAITVAVTVDNKMGVAFNKRRQSRDKKLIEDLCLSTENEISISSYSLPLFEEWTSRVKVYGSPLAECADGGVCFVEISAIGKHVDEISELIVYRWNKVYPSDKKLDIIPEECGFIKVSTSDFAGNSHDVITKEIYRKAV